MIQVLLLLVNEFIPDTDQYNDFIERANKTMYDEFNIDQFKNSKQKILEEQHEKMLEIDGVSEQEEAEEVESDDEEEDSYMYGEY